MGWLYRKVWDAAGNPWLIVSPSDGELPTLVLDGHDIKDLNEEWEEAPPGPDDLQRE